MAQQLNSKYLQETGILSAYQSFLSKLIEDGPGEEDILLQASKFILNYEKQGISMQSRYNFEYALPVEQKSEKIKQERRKIVLTSKPKIFPYAQKLDPSNFQRTERKRPLISTYRREELNFSYVDILDGKLVQINPENPPLKIDLDTFSIDQSDDYQHLKVQESFPLRKIEQKQETYIQSEFITVNSKPMIVREEIQEEKVQEQQLKEQEQKKEDQPEEIDEVEIPIDEGFVLDEDQNLPLEEDDIENEPSVPI